MRTKRRLCALALFLLAMLCCACATSPPRTSTTEERAAAEALITTFESGLVVARATNRMSAADFALASNQLYELRQAVAESETQPVHWIDVYQRVLNFGVQWALQKTLPPAAEPERTSMSENETQAAESAASPTTSNEQAAAIPPTQEIAEHPPARQLIDHMTNPANARLRIEVLDPPGSGGAQHLYRISGFNSGSNPSCPWQKLHGAPADHSHILFQNGPIGEVGVNGVTHEALLAILIDRLRCFQEGRFACGENARALQYLEVASQCLQARTQLRMQRGVEGTHEV